MDDLISRTAALDAIDGIKPMQGNMEQLAMKALCWAAVKTIQPVNAAPGVHARWYDKGSLSCRCSCCGCKSNKEYNYCPNCGARMDGEADA